MAAEDHNGEAVDTQGEYPDCGTTERSFDELARGLANGKLTRRKALGMLGGALLGGALASVPGMAWAAKPGCASGVTCKGKCCPVGATCAKGAGGGCTCSTGQTVCSGQCVSLTTNQNCGSCGSACSGGKTCQAGVCACPQGQTDCGGVCRDLTTDVANCGSCGNVCPVPDNATAATCEGGECSFVCNDNYTNVSDYVCCPNAQTCPNGSGCCPEGQGCVELAFFGGNLCAPFCTGASNYCCSCSYRNTQTGGGYVQGACDSPTTLTREQCDTYCQNNTPPGYDEWAAEYLCSSDPQVYPYNLTCNQNGCLQQQCAPT